MRLADMNWAIQMDFNVYKEVTEIGLRYHIVQAVMRW